MTEEELKEIYQTISKSSGEYKKHYLENKSITHTEETDPLSTSLEEATHLTDATKKRYLELAEYFMSSMESNLFSNQFELKSKYPGTTVDEWNDFLSDRIVSVYINRHKRTLLKSAAEDNLADPTARNKRDNLNLLTNLKAEEDAESNKNVCIMRIPDIYDED